MRATKICISLLLLTCLLLPAAAAESAEPIAFGPLSQIWTDSGFVPPFGHAWGDAIDDVRASFAHPEKMDPESDAFVEMARRVNSANGYVSLYPEEVYAIDGVDFPVTFVWEFDAQGALYGVWIVGEMLPLDTATDADKETFVGCVRFLAEALSEGRETIFEGEGIAPADMTFDGLKATRSRLFWEGGDGTFCQFGARVHEALNTYFCNIGFGMIDPWPAVGAILEKLEK